MARKTSASSTGVRLQGTKRKADDTQAAFREPFDRQAVDLISPSPPPSLEAPLTKKPRETLQLSRDIDIPPNSGTLRQDGRAISNDADLILPVPRALGRDVTALSTANASIAAASRSRDFDFIQNRPQPQAMISATRLNNKFRAPYIEIANLEVSADGIMQLAKFLRGLRLE
jgi:hypothetical protein